MHIPSTNNSAVWLCGYSGPYVFQVLLLSLTISVNIQFPPWNASRGYHLFPSKEAARGKKRSFKARLWGFCSFLRTDICLLIIHSPCSFFNHSVGSGMVLWVIRTQWKPDKIALFLGMDTWQHTSWWHSREHLSYISGRYSPSFFFPEVSFYQMDSWG